MIQEVFDTIENYFKESDSLYMIEISHANNDLRDLITNSQVEFLSKSYYTEKTEDSLFSGVKEFFGKIIAALQKYVRELEIRFDEWIRDKEIRVLIRKAKKQIEEDREAGAKTVELPDIWNMSKRYKEINKELYGYAKKFAETKYRRISDLESDISKFEALVNKYNSELVGYEEKKVKMPVSKAIDFINSEIEGRSTLLDDLNEDISKLKNLEKECENIKIRLYAQEGNIIPEHMSIMRRVTTSISNFTKKIRKKIKTSIIRIMQAVIIIF